MKFAKLLLLAALTLLLPLPASAAGPTITLVPSPLQAPVGQVVPLAVRINNVENLYGFDVQLKFDPAVVEIQDADPRTPLIDLLPGDFLSYDFALHHEADNTTGTASFVMTQINPSEARSGSGTLFTIYVKGKAAGKSAFEITYAKLADRNGEEINVTSTDGEAQVSVAVAPPSNSPTPLPTAPAPQIDLTQAVAEAAQTPTAQAPQATPRVDPTATAPETATSAPATTVASPATVAPAATPAPAEVTAPTSAAPVAAAEVTPAPATADGSPQPTAQSSDATPAAAQAAAAEPTVVAESAAGAATSAANAPAGPDAPTRVSTASQQSGSNTLLFAGGGLLLLAAAGAIGLVVLRRGK